MVEQLLLTSREARILLVSFIDRMVEEVGHTPEGKELAALTDVQIVHKMLMHHFENPEELGTPDDFANLLMRLAPIALPGEVLILDEIAGADA